jgi:paraquat-inducible protein B
MAENDNRDELPAATVVPRKRSRISVIWVIPIFAALVAIGIAVQRVMSEGPVITIVFNAAEGIEAGKTFVKYKDVNIGQVSAVELSDDFITVTVKVAKLAAGLIVEDAKFWVVSPRIGLSGISGLGTLLSGNYIGFETGKSTARGHSYVGVEVPPVISNSTPGREFLLQTSDIGSLGVGSPVYYRRLLAGQVIAYDLAKDGKQIEIKVFVNAPFDKFVTTGSRFWNASGLDVSIGAGGIDVRSQSLVSLVAGGVSFETPPFVQDTVEAAADSVYTLYTDQTSAMKQPDVQAVRYVLHFNEPLRGLSVGAPVTFLGLQGGMVTDVGLEFNRETMEARGRVEIVMYLERLIGRLGRNQATLAQSLRTSNRIDLLRGLIEKRGLRAQLKSGNLLTGQLYVGLDFYPNAPKVKFDTTATPIELPVIASPLPELEAKIGSILTKIDALPFAAIGSDLQTTLASASKLMKDADVAMNRINTEVTPELKPTIQSFRKAIESADQVLKSTDANMLGKDSLAQEELRNAMQEVTRAARSVSVLTDYLERHPDALIRGKTEEKP